MRDGFAARILECWVKVVMRLVHILPVHEETEMAVLGSGELAGIFEVPGTRCWYWTRRYKCGVSDGRYWRFASGILGVSRKPSLMMEIHDRPPRRVDTGIATSDDAHEMK